MRRGCSTWFRTGASVQSARHAVQTVVSPLLLLIGLLGTAGAQAHLMTAQRGTLNFVDTGAFMVLSLPVAAFTGVDHDGDQLLSIAEFEAGRRDIMAAVKRQVKLLDENGVSRPLEGLMLSPAPAHDAPAAPASHVIVMGRFALAEADGSYRLTVGLYGDTPEEQTLRIKASRPSAEQTQPLQLTPEKASGKLFPSANAATTRGTVTKLDRAEAATMREENEQALRQALPPPR